jgi:hypothetical protein
MRSPRPLLRRDPMAKHTLVAFTNAKEGRDEEFNAWYTDQHMRDLLRCPGFVTAQRFEMSDAQRGAPPPYKYMAIYEVETEDLEQTIQTMLARVGTDQMPMSDALNPERVVWAYYPTTPVVSEQE